MNNTRSFVNRMWGICLFVGMISGWDVVWGAAPPPPRDSELDRAPDLATKKAGFGKAPAPRTSVSGFVAKKGVQPPPPVRNKLNELKAAIEKLQHQLQVLSVKLGQLKASPPPPFIGGTVPVAPPPPPPPPFIGGTVPVAPPPPPPPLMGGADLGAPQLAVEPKKPDAGALLAGASLLKKVAKPVEDVKLMVEGDENEDGPPNPPIPYYAEKGNPYPHYYKQPDGSLATKEIKREGKIVKPVIVIPKGKWKKFETS